MPETKEELSRLPSLRVCVSLAAGLQRSFNVPFRVVVGERRARSRPCLHTNLEREKEALQTLLEEAADVDDQVSEMVALVKQDLAEPTALPSIVARALPKEPSQSRIWRSL